jgi:uncharacterized protein YjbK
MLEKEYKALINSKQYKKMQSAFLWDNKFFQKNYYYDTTDMYCAKHGITVIIREKENEYFLQIKTPITYDGGLHIKKEFERKIPELVDVIFSEDFDISIPLVIPNVAQIGVLVTERFEFHDKNTTVCLDRNTYNGNIDFEVEVEYYDSINLDIIKKLMLFGVSFDKTTDGKFTRFIKSL